MGSKKIYCIIERNSKFARIGTIPISYLTESQIEGIDKDDIFFSTREKAEYAVEKYYQYNER